VTSNIFLNLQIGKYFGNGSNARSAILRRPFLKFKPQMLFAKKPFPFAVNEYFL